MELWSLLAVCFTVVLCIALVCATVITVADKWLVSRTMTKRIHAIREFHHHEYDEPEYPQNGAVNRRKSGDMWDDE